MNTYTLDQDGQTIIISSTKTVEERMSVNEIQDFIKALKAQSDTALAQIAIYQAKLDGALLALPELSVKDLTQIPNEKP